MRRMIWERKSETGEGWQEDLSWVLCHVLLAAPRSSISIVLLLLPGCTTAVQRASVLLQTLPSEGECIRHSPGRQAAHQPTCAWVPASAVVDCT